MSERDDLLRGIREHPEDDAPRLVFADWLDEHYPGQGKPAERAREWAVSIRRQIEASHTPRTDPRYWDHWAWRITAKPPTDTSLVPSAVRKWVSHGRGFPESVRISAHGFAIHAPTFAEAIAPLWQLHLSGARSFADALARPELARFRHLGVSGLQLSDTDAQLIADCPHLAGLTRLSLGSLTSGGAAPILASPTLAGLRRLSIVGNLTSHAVQLLRAATVARPLERLDLRCSVDADHTLALVTAPSLANLTHLGLDHATRDGQFLRALADGVMPRLTSLRLSGPILIGEFVRSACFRQLTDLTFAQGISDEALAMWPEDAGPANLSLSLTFPYLDQLAALVRSPIVGRCVSLTVGHPGLRLVDLIELARSPFAEHLRIIDCNNGYEADAVLDGRALEPFTRSPYLAGLIELRYPGRHLTDDGLRALTEATFADSLRCLDLDFCGRLSADALLRLTDPSVLPNLQSLRLNGGVVHSDPAVAVALRERWPINFAAR